MFFFYTTRFHSFTDENIPYVFTDGLRLSTFLSSVILHSVAISVGNTKKPFVDGFTDGICALKKCFLLEIYRRILFRR